MASKSEKDRQKQIQERCQALLTQMLRDEDNKYCVDCDAKGPRWASWNLGIFLCIRCAGIHRNLGVHISKVKSVNLDAWTPEQVVSLQQMGNSRARAVYEANLPDNFRRPQTDSSLEAFVRAKYEQKKYIAREWVPPPIPKVNWDKELDEEAEKQKKKRKEAKLQQTRKSVTPLPEVPLPQPLPKPKGSSPKVSRISADANKHVPKPVARDLLGLENPVTSSPVSSNKEDFSGFLSASSNGSEFPSTMKTTPVKQDDVTTGRSAEEESFFNQTTASNKEKQQLSKDSILALYSTVPAQPQSISPQVFGVSGGIYTQTQPYFSQTTAQPMGYSVPNGVMPVQSGAAGLIQNGVFTNAGMMPSQPVTGFSSNPFYNISAPPVNPAVFSQVTQEHAMPAKSADLILDFETQPSDSSKQTVTSQQLPQQFMRMNMSGLPVAGSQTPNVMGMTTALPSVGVQIPAINVSQNIHNATQPFPAFQTTTNTGQSLATNLWQ